MLHRDDFLGTLQMKVCEGKLFRDTETFGKMDPFIEILYNGKTYRTKVDNEGGKEPVWNDVFEIPIYLSEKQCTIKCIDEDLFSNDNVGEVQLNIDTFCG